MCSKWLRTLMSWSGEVSSTVRLSRNGLRCVAFLPRWPQKAFCRLAAAVSNSEGLRRLRRRHHDARQIRGLSQRSTSNYIGMRLGVDTRAAGAIAWRGTSPGEIPAMKRLVHQSHQLVSIDLCVLGASVCRDPSSKTRPRLDWSGCPRPRKCRWFDRPASDRWVADVRIRHPTACRWRSRRPDAAS